MGSTLKHMGTNHHFIGLLLAAGLTSASTQAATIIYQDDFSGAAVSLSGVAPDVRPGTEVWASDNLRADGTVSTASRSSWLPYSSFDDDVQYTLSVKSDIGYQSGSATPKYVAFSIANPLNIGNTIGAGTQAVAILGVTRGGGYTFQIGPGNTAIVGSGSGLFAENQDDLEVRLVLTTSSTSNWTLAGYVGTTQVDLDNAASGLLYTLPSDFPTLVTLRGVGMGYNSAAVGGFVAEGFTFSSAPVPEPSMLTAMIGGLALIGRRARRR